MNEQDYSKRLLTRRSMIAGGFLAGASLIANSRRPDIPFRMIQGAKIDPLFPNKVGNWEFTTTNGLVLPPADQLSDRLYNAILTRYYSSPNQLPVMMLVAYNGKQDGMLQVHRPETCYPAAGYDLLKQQMIPLDAGGGITVPGHYISARSTSRVEQLIYWTRIGNDFPVKWWAQHWAVAKENLRGRIPDGVLVRFSTAAPDDEVAVLTLNRFITAMFAELGPTARRLIFGEAGAPLPAK
jgi:EpsI family protein